VSILIPAYQAQQWIEETLASALAQTWPNVEIILIDDGSSDRTVDLASRFKSSKIRIQKQAHQGASAARNHAFAFSQGDYIQWLDADDVLATTKIERQMQRALERASDRTLYSCSWAKFMHRRSSARFVPTALWRDLPPLEWLLLKMEQNIYMQTASWLVPRRLAEAAGPWNTQLLSDDDGEYFARVLLQADHVAFVPEAVMFHRTAIGHSLSHVGTSDARLEAQLRSIELNINYVCSLEESARVHQACLSYLQAGFPYFHIQRPDLAKRVEELAAKLGGRVVPPSFSWKYRWIESLLGQRSAHQAQIVFPRARWALLRRWDRLVRLVEMHGVRSWLP
jgi:glycosyltransferase involved in cell wall biosynthesis